MEYNETLAPSYDLLTKIRVFENPEDALLFAKLSIWAFTRNSL